MLSEVLFCIESRLILKDILLLKTTLRITPARLIALMQAFPDDLLSLAPAPGEWSPIEVLRHLIFAERTFTGRLEALLAGEEFPAPKLDGDDLTASPLE